VDDAEQRAHRKRGSDLEPGPELVPSPLVHPDLAPLTALAAAHQDRAPHRVEVAFGQAEALADPQPSPPQDNDQATKPNAVDPVSGASHDSDDFLDARRIRWIAQTLIHGRSTGVVTRQRGRRTTATTDIQQR
jgi:hypothetical protein